ncbi:kinase-like domain-containing protein [Rhizophagus irregularis DAOM 181602=DAOM 197198]|nr:kinase-like domain-containing protein [Rhizophagus irregularis DAOM 181602=DAOM 197198]
MSITLLCLVKGNTTASAFPIDINKDQLVGHLKKVIKAEKAPEFDNFPADKLRLWKVTIPGDQDDQLRNLILQDSDELLAIRKISKYFPDSPPEEHIHVIVKLPRNNNNTYSFPVLSLEEALSCIPPPITYSTDCVTSKTTTKAVGDPPASVQLWDDFFDKVNQFRFDQQPIFERPRFDDRFVIVDEEDVRNAINFNICMVLNDLTGPDYVYSRKSTDTPGIPDFNCHLVGSLILVIEAKRKHVLEDMGEETFPEFYQTSKGGDVIQQIYNYMGGNELRYGILTTYDNHWFLRREHAKLWISKTLPLKSESPPSSSNSSLNQQQSSSTFANQQLSSNTSVKQNNYSFSDFKFKSILGEGRSGKTLLCEFRGDMIALKSADLSKAPSYVLEEMQKEVEIYKDLADIQGKYIPKLVCYGYYGGGMSFVIGMTIVGTSLSDQKIKKQQKTRAIKGLEAIHKHGILHNDIREENILINDKGALYLIDFGMASREDTKKKRKLFEEEQLKLSQLLDGYIVHFVKKEGRTSKSRKCKVVS